MPQYAIPHIRLGSTSFLEPVDYVPGFRHAAGLCEDVSLLVMMVGEAYQYLISTEDVREIARIADGEGISVNIHLPYEHSFETEDGARRMVEDVAKVAERTAPLAPHTFVLHVCFPSLDNVLLGPNPKKLGVTLEQRELTARALDKIAAMFPGPEYLAVENLESLPPDFWDVWVQDSDFSRCMDVGHLWKDGWDPQDFLPSWLAKTRLIHLHGMEARPKATVSGEILARTLPETPLRTQLRSLFGPAPRDHKSLHNMPLSCIDSVMHTLWDAGWQGVLNIEVFHTEDFVRSHETILRSYDRYLARSNAHA